MTNKNKSKKAAHFGKIIKQLIGDISKQGGVKEPDKLKRFRERFALSESLNKSIFKIFSNYFNILSEKTDLQEQHGIRVIGLMKDDEFLDNIICENFGKKYVFLEYEGLSICCCFDVYKQQNELFYEFYMSSSMTTYITADFFYKKIWAHALQVSDLKGSYFVMERNQLQWEKKPLENRTFNDIYLPSSTIEDLKLYVVAGVETGRLMRYLMAGHPGTGKTESTLVLANELNKLGVTIIKTPVCSAIKDKIELASLLAPSLIIFDDIDLSLGSRKTGVHAERMQDFLDVMDGTDKLPYNVGIIATTNSVGLLDLAAQRPGRFDKTLSFDELTLDNIKNIILKSLKFEFKVSTTNPVTKLFTDLKIIKLFKDSNVTGAHIYNSVKMLKLRADMLKLKIDIEILVNEFTKELKTIDKIRKTDYLSDKLNSNDRKSIGFYDNESKEDDFGEYECHDIEKGLGKSSCSKLNNKEALKISLDKNLFPD